MSIFEAMERLAGAALLALAPALKVAVPTRQRGRGMDLVQMLRQRGADGADRDADHPIAINLFDWIKWNHP